MKRFLFVMLLLCLVPMAFAGTNEGGDGWLTGATTQATASTWVAMRVAINVSEVNITQINVSSLGNAPNGTILDSSTCAVLAACDTPMSGGVCNITGGYLASGEILVAADGNGAGFTMFASDFPPSPALPYANTNVTWYNEHWLQADSCTPKDVGASRVRGPIGFVTEAIATPGAVNVITLQLQNEVNGSTWPESVTFSNLSGTMSFEFFNITPTGFCVNYSGNGTGTNCSASNGASAFFNTTNLSVSVPTSSKTVYGRTYQALLSLDATRLFLNTSIGSFNATNDQATNTTASQLLTVPANNGTNNVQVDVAGNYSLNFTFTISSPLMTENVTASGFYDNIFTINATDAVTGGAVTSFTVNATNNTLGTTSNVTTTGEGDLLLLQGYDWTFFIDSTGYAYSNVTLPANASTNTYEFSLLPSNSIFLYFYDEQSLASIDFQNVTVEYSNTSDTFTAVNDSGEMLLEDLTAGTWTLDVSSNGYEDRQYFVTIGERSSQDLDVYLLNSSAASTTTFTVKDADTADIIPGATMSMAQKVGSNWVTIDQKITDAFGIAVFELVDGKEYRFTIEATGYNTKVGTFTRTEASYIVILGSANTQDFTTYLDDFTYNVAPDDVGLNSTDFELITSSPDGRLDWFSVSVLLNGSTTTSNVTASPSGGTASVTLNLSDYSGYTVVAVYRVKSQSFDDILEVSRSWYIYGLQSGNYTFTNFMEHYSDDDNGLSFASRGILLTVAAVFLAIVVGLFFGFEGAAVIATIVFLAGGYYDWIHWSISIVISVALIGTLIVRGGGVR